MNEQFDKIVRDEFGEPEKTVNGDVDNPVSIITRQRIGSAVVTKVKSGDTLMTSIRGSTDDSDLIAPSAGGRPGRLLEITRDGSIQGIIEVGINEDGSTRYVEDEPEKFNSQDQ